jgi:adenylosuccinate lyase
MISPSGIKEVGKSIVEHSERAQAASTVESTALPSGFGEARCGLSRETNRLQKISSRIERIQATRIAFRRITGPWIP